MALKHLCILSLVIGLSLNAAYPQQGSGSGTSASLYYYDNENQQTLCYFVNGQPLCGEEGKKAREADRERIKRLRDQTRESIPGGGNFQRPRGDADSLPQGDSPFQDDGPVIHPRNPSPNNYKGHVRPNNDKGHVVPTIPPPTTPKPTRPPTPRPTRKPCPPPTTTQPPCPNRRTTTTLSPCQQKATTPSPCPYQTTEHPDIAEWRRTRHRNSRPQSYQALGSYQSDQNQQGSDFLRNREAWISASSGKQNNGIQSDQPIQGNSDGWWINNKEKNKPKSRISSQTTIFRSSRTFENDHNGVARIPEIDVPRNGVILSVVSDQPKPGLPQKKQKPTRISVSGVDGAFASRAKSNNRGRLQLYQYFQRKARERKNNFKQNHF